MSPEWQRALGISLALHLFLLASLWGLSRPWRPAPPKVVRISLRSIAMPLAPAKHLSSKHRAQTLKRSQHIKKKEPVRPKTSRLVTRSKGHAHKRKIKAKKPRKLPHRAVSPPGPTPTEERLLREKLAALKAKAEEEELTKKLAALSQKVHQKGGLSLSGKGISQGVLARIAARLKAFWEIPVVLKDRHDLWAEVELEVAPDGKILSWRFKHPSGEPLFDEAVRRTLELANPLPPPGKTLLLPVVFRIQEQ